MPLLLMRWYRAVCHCGTEYWIKGTDKMRDGVFCDNHGAPQNERPWLEFKDFASALPEPDKVPDEFLADCMVTIANALVDIRNKLLA